MKMKKYFWNVKISEEFYNLLMSSDVYKNNFKAIGPAYSILTKISGRNSESKPQDNGYSSMSSVLIQDLFRSHIEDGKYLPYLKGLKDLQLLERDDNYSVLNEKSYYYRTTDLCNKVLNKSLKYYLKELQFNQKLKKYIKDKQIRHKRINYSDYLRNYLQDLMDNIDFNNEIIDEELDKFEGMDATQNHICKALINIAEHNDKPFEQNITDSRIWNEIVGMKSSMRRGLLYKNLNYNYTIDIRSCHPLFFGRYNLINYISNHLSLLSSFSSIVMLNVRPIHQKSNDLIYYNIFDEYLKWTKFFTDIVDPRIIISNDIGWGNSKKSIKRCKQALNETINGSRKYKKVCRWIEEEYPLLYKVWMETDIKETGPNISKMFETVIMKDEALYRLADSLMVKLSYEYDGVGVFSLNSDPDIINKLNIISNWITNKSIELFDIPVVVTIKNIKGEVI